MTFTNWIQGISKSMFSKDVELDKKLEAKLKNIKAGNVLWKEIQRDCKDVEEYDRKLHLLRANGCVDEKTFDAFKTDKTVEAYEKVMKATEGLKADDKKKALLMLGVENK